MNKVYRLVWNKATQTWNAVSEYAKSQGKSSNAVIMPSLKGAYGVIRAVVRFAYTALVSALLLLSGRAALAATGTHTANGAAVPSTSDYNTCYYDVTSQSVVCGSENTKTADTADTKQAKAVVMGVGSSNTGESNIVIGSSATTGDTIITETTTKVTQANGNSRSTTTVEITPAATVGTTNTTTSTNPTDNSTTEVTTVVKQAMPVAAIAIGNEAKALDNQSIAIGQRATANADWDISIGRNAGSNITSIASEGRNIAIGDGALQRAVSPNNNIALGTDASAGQTGNFNVAIGTYANSPTALSSATLDDGTILNTRYTSVTANNAVAIGERALATQNNAISMGNRTKSVAAASVAIGSNAEASGGYSVAHGYGALASGASSVAVGGNQNLTNKTVAKGQFSVAVGSLNTKAEGESSVAIGRTANASTSNAIAIGREATVEATGLVSTSVLNATSTGAIAIGANSTSKGKSSIAIGNNISSQTHGVAIGVNSTASEVGAITIGQNNTTTTKNSVSIGSNTHATGNNSFAGGNDTKAAGQSSVAIGDGAKANTDATVSGNGWGTAVGNNAAAEYAASAYGYQAKALGGSSVAIGNTVATGQHSVAIGNNAKANDIGSIAIGRTTTATGQNSVVVGTSNESAANNTVVIGTSSKATKENAIAVGNKAVAYNTGNIVLGTNSGQITDSANVANVGADSILVGAEAGKDSYSNAKQVAMGFKAGQNVSGAENIAIGNNAGSGTAADRLSITKTVAIGSDAKATKNNAIALGNNAKSQAEAAIAIGQNAGLTSDVATSNTNSRAIMIGVNSARNAQNINDSILIGQDAGENLGVANQTGNNNIGLGARALKDATGSTNVALATQAGQGAEGNNNFFGQVNAGSYVSGNNNIAIGRNAQRGEATDRITANDTIALGTESKATKNSAIAIGTGAQATAINAISIGTGNVVNGENSGALGDPSYISGTGTYTIGNNNGTAAQSVSANNAGAFGNNNALTGHGSRIIGNDNNVTGGNTFVMGNNVSASASNNVILGHDSSENSATTTNGAPTQVTSATIGSTTYSGFAGTATGVVSVGAANKERQIINVAPGEISATSTDAINGSQLYVIADQMSSLQSSVQTTPLTVNTTTNAGKVDAPATADANKLVTANDIVNAINNSGFVLTTAATTDGEVSGTTNELIKAGDTAVIEADKNIKVTQNNGKVTIATKDDVTFNSVTAGDTVVNGDGVTVGNDVALTNTGIKAGDVELNTTGINAGNKAITNVAAGTDDADAVNVSQLKGATNALGLTIDQSTGAVSAPSFVVTQADGTKHAAVTTVQEALDNIGTEIQKPLTFVGDDIASADGAVVRGLGSVLKITGDIDDPNIELSSAGNIAVVADEDNNALRLKLAKDLLDMQSVVTRDAASDNSSILNGSGITITDSATNPTKEVSLTINGLDNGDNKIINVADGDISATSKDAVNGSQLYATNQNVTKNAGDIAANKTAIADNATNIAKGLNFGANDQSQTAGSPINRQLGEVIGIKGGITDTTKATSGENVITRTDSNGNINIELAKDATFDSVTTGNTVVNNDGVKVGSDVALTNTGIKAGDVELNTTGINAGNKAITNVAAGTDDADAVNVSQLKAVETKAAVKTKVKAGDGVEVTNDGTADEPDYTVAINQTTKDDIAKGVAAKDAVDNKGLSFNGDAGTTTGVKKLGDSLDFTGDSNITTKADANGVQVTLNENLNVKSVVADGTKIDANGLSFVDNTGNAIANSPVISKTGINAGNQKVSSVADGDISATSKDAVNGSQLYATNQNVTKNAGDIAANKTAIADNATNIAKGLNFGANDQSQTAGSPINRQLGEVIGIKGGITDTTKATSGENVITRTDSNGNINIELAKDATFDSVTTGNTVVNNDGVKVGSDVALSNTGIKAGDVELNTTGINAGNKAITNVAAGTDDADAVNVSQLKAVETKAAAKTTATAGKNITLKSTANNDGSTNYEIATADEVSFNKTTVGNVVVDANTNKMTGLNKGDVNANSTDAVNGSQLYAQGEGVKNIIGGSTTYNPNTGAYTNSDIGGTGKDNIDAAIKAVKTEVVAGDNITVTQSADSDGKTTYTVATKKDLTVDSVKAGDVTINAAGINAGDTIITGVKSGLNGKTLDEIKADPNAAERSNAATIGDLTQVQNNVTNINTTVNQVIGGTTSDGKITDASGNPVKDKNGQDINVSDALKTYNVSGNQAKTDNTLITAVKNMNEGGIKFFHVNDGTGEQNVSGSDAHAEDSAASGNYAAAVGYQAKAEGENAIAIGKGSTANAKNAISIGTGNIVTGENSGAIGDPSIINGANSYSVGNNNTVSTNNTFVLGNNVTQTVENSVFLGNNSSSTGVHTTAAGGNYTYAGANDAGVAGVSDAVGVVSVGREGETRQIQNVAAGVVSATSTDAINGSQLYDTHQAINNMAGNTINIANQLNNRIDEVKDDANAGVSSAMAMAALPQAYIPGKSMITGGMATYNGEGAVAVGLSKLSDNGRWVLKISGSADTQGNAGGAVGAGFHF